MEILVDDKWKIFSDDLCVAVAEGKYNKKTGEHYWFNKWFYPSLTMALTSLVEKDIQMTELKDVVDRLKYVQQVITQAVGRLADQ